MLQASFAYNKLLLYRSQACGNTPLPRTQSNKIQKNSNQSERTIRSTDPDVSHEKRDTKTYQALTMLFMVLGNRMQLSIIQTLKLTNNVIT